MAGLDLFDRPLFTPINFDTRKEGIVVGNDHFETDFYIDVFIQELFINEVPMISTDKKLNVNTPDRTLVTSQISKNLATGTRLQLATKIDAVENKLATNYYTDTEYIRSILYTATSMVNDSKISSDDPNLKKMLDTLSEAENGLQKKDTIETVNVSNIVNSDNLIYNSQVTTINYIKCYPIEYNGYKPSDFKNLPEEAQRKYKPEIGSKVLVEFWRGDPKLPYYTYESLYSIDPIIIPDNIGNTGKDIHKNNNVADQDQFATDTQLNYADRVYHRLILHTQPLMMGGDIYRIRTKLKELGSVFTIDSSNTNSSYLYDEELEAHVTKFQIDHQIQGDKKGTVGPITYDAIMDEADKINARLAVKDDYINGHPKGYSKPDLVAIKANSNDYTRLLKVIEYYDISDTNIFNNEYDNEASMYDWKNRN